MSNASPEISPMARDIVMLSLGMAIGLMCLIPLAERNDKLRKKLKKTKRQLRALHQPRLEKTA